MLFPKQACLQWKTAAGQFRVGRVEFADGSEPAPKNATLAALKTTRINMRLIGHFGWTHAAGLSTACPTQKPVLTANLRSWARYPRVAFSRLMAGAGIKSRNTADGTHNTFFHVLPTPRPFARFPFFNRMNNRDIYAELTLRSHARLSISNEFHGLSLANRNGL
ncbi:MAG: hypothetical protein EXQ57_06540 [Bryobacterales bacterium]|nr:hypothetical protein [Bryobacterales bacterium]